MNKRAMLTVLFSMVGMLMSSYSVASASDDEYWREFRDRVQADTAAINEFIEINNDPSSTTADITTKANETILNLNLSQNYYAIRPKGDDEQTISKLVRNYYAIALTLGLYRNALVNGDMVLADTHQSALNSDLASLNRSLDEMEKSDSLSVDQESQSALDQERLVGQMLWGGAIVTSLLIILLLIAANRQGDLTAEVMKGNLLRGLAFALIIPAVGLWISSITFALASSGGSYVVASGAILFGGFAVLKRTAYIVSNWRTLSAEAKFERLLSTHYSWLKDAHLRLGREDFISIVGFRFSVDQKIAPRIFEYFDNAIYRGASAEGGELSIS